MAMAASPAFAVSAVPVVASAGASVAAVRAFAPTAEFAVAVCAEWSVASGHRLSVAVVSAAPADVSARRAAALGLVAAGADQSVAGVFARARDWREPRPTVSTKGDDLD